MSAQRILIIDDDPDFIALLAEGLTDRGHRCRAENDARRLRPDDWAWADLAIVDLQLGQGEDGPRILRRLRALKAQPRIVLVSGFDVLVLAAAARAASDMGYAVAGAFSKPIAINALVSAVAAPAPTPRSSGVRGRAPVTASDLIRGLDGHEITVVFQPKVTLSNGAFAGFEVLARWSSPVLGEVSADRFVAAAEAFGLAERFTAAVISRAMRAASAWDAVGFSPPISLNLSAGLLEADGLVDRLLDQITRFGIAPAQITFELTETAAMSMRGRALEAVTRLRLAGFGLSLDDFGMGENRFERLLGLPLTEVKLDRRFAQLVTKPHGRRLVGGLTALVHGLGASCVAEGIEDQAQLKAFRAAGCDVGQGWRLSRPLAAPADCVEFAHAPIPMFGGHVSRRELHTRPPG